MSRIFVKEFIFHTEQNVSLPVSMKYLTTKLMSQKHSGLAWHFDEWYSISGCLYYKWDSPIIHGCGPQLVGPHARYSKLQVCNPFMSEYSVCLLTESDIGRRLPLPHVGWQHKMGSYSYDTVGRHKGSFKTLFSHPRQALFKINYFCKLKVLTSSTSDTA